MSRPQPSRGQSLRLRNHGHRSLSSPANILDALTVNVQTSGEDGPEAPDENALLNFDEFEALDMPKDEVDRLPSVV
jgi:hypothetical protein